MLLMLFCFLTLGYVDVTVKGLGCNRSHVCTGFYRNSGAELRGKTWRLL